MIASERSSSEAPPDSPTPGTPRPTEKFTEGEFDVLAAKPAQHLINLASPDWSLPRAKLCTMLHRAVGRAQTAHIGAERAFEALGGRGRSSLRLGAFTSKLRGLGMSWAGFSKDELLALACAIDGSCSGHIAPRDLARFAARYPPGQEAEPAIVVPKDPAEVKFMRSVGHARAASFPIVARLLALVERSGSRRAPPNKEGLVELLQDTGCAVSLPHLQETGAVDEKELDSAANGMVAALDALLDDIARASASLDEHVAHRRAVFDEAKKWVDEFTMVRLCHWAYDDL